MPRKSKISTVISVGTFLLSASLLSVSAHADDLVTIFNLAADNDPEIRQARAEYNAFHTNLDQGRSALLPTISLSGNTGLEASGPSEVPPGSPLSPYAWSDNYSSEGYGLNLNQNLLNFEAWYNYNAIKKSDEAQAANLGRLEQQLIQRVADAYFNVLRSIDNLTSFQGELDAAERQLEQTRQRFEVGLIPITDVYEGQANYDLTRVNLLVEENNLSQRYEALEAITGQNHDEVSILKEDFPIIPADPVGIEEWVTFSLENNLDIKTAELNYNSKEEEARAAKAAMYPVVDLSAGYSWRKSDSPFSFFPGGVANESANITLNLSMPLYTGGLNNARKRQAYYNRDASEEIVLRTQRTSIQDTRNSYRSLASDVLTVAARQQAIISAQSQLEATEVGADVGTRNVVDVVIAQRLLYQAERDYANARYDYVIETLNLKQAAGILNPQDITDLNDWLE